MYRSGESVHAACSNELQQRLSSELQRRLSGDRNDTERVPMLLADSLSPPPLSFTQSQRWFSRAWSGGREGSQPSGAGGGGGGGGGNAGGVAVGMRRLDGEEDEEDPGDAMFRRPRRELHRVTGAPRTPPPPPPQLATFEIE